MNTRNMIFSHRGIRASSEWFRDNAEKRDDGSLKPIFDMFVNTRQVGELKIFHLLATLMDTDIPLIITTRTEEKVEITFIIYSKTECFEPK